MKVSTTSVLISSLACTANAFMPVTSTRARLPMQLSMKHQIPSSETVESFDPLNLSSPDANEFLSNVDNKASWAPLVALAFFAPEVANAAGPDWGIFEGRTGSLLHPIVMGGTFLLSCSAALKGFQYRRQRTLGDEISALKKTLPDLGGASTVKDAISQANAAENPDGALVAKLQAALPIQNEIDALVAERKDLSSKGLRDSHFSQGALLAFLGTAFAIEGPLNTYARAGKLFPGPHLYAGAGLVVLWAAAAACVPAMQKGNDTARSIHIAANVSGMGLFAWQIITGWPILLKVTELTKWP